MGKKHPTFAVGDILTPNLRGREEVELKPGFYIVTEILRGPGMMVRYSTGWKSAKAMRKHFEMFMSGEEYAAMKVAAALMAPEGGR